MRYRVYLGSVPVECDAIEDVVALVEKAGGVITEGNNFTRKLGETSPTGSRWTEARMTEFFGRLKGMQRKLIDELLDHPDGRTDDQLCDLLGLNDGKRLAGVMTGLYKNAKKVGADPKEVYAKQALNIADRKVNEYTLRESFRKIAETVRRKPKK